LAWLSKGDYKKLGRLLKETRLKAKVGQTELASKLRKPQSFISSYERGERRLDILEFLRVTSALNVDPRRLFAEIMRMKFGRD
jgi:predicted transcriptional regulator